MYVPRPDNLDLQYLRERHDITESGIQGSNPDEEPDGSSVEIVPSQPDEARVLADIKP